MPRLTLEQRVRLEITLGIIASDNVRWNAAALVADVPVITAMVLDGPPAQP